MSEEIKLTGDNGENGDEVQNHDHRIMGYSPSPRSARTAMFMFIAPRPEKTFLAPAGRHVLFRDIPQTVPLLTELGMDLF